MLKYQILLALLALFTIQLDKYTGFRYNPIPFLALAFVILFVVSFFI